jgi:hypothetical protein
LVRTKLHQGKEAKGNVVEVDADPSVFSNGVVEDELSSEVLDELPKFLGLSSFSSPRLISAQVFEKRC